MGCAIAHHGGELLGAGRWRQGAGGSTHAQGRDKERDVFDGGRGAQRHHAMIAHAIALQRRRRAVDQGIQLRIGQRAPAIDERDLLGLFARMSAY